VNIVFVEPEWTDLEETISYLRDHPDIAKGIAKRQREMVVDASYLSPAAEICHWRALIRAWSQVAKPNELDWGTQTGDRSEHEKGMRWETFNLAGKTTWN